MAPSENHMYGNMLYTSVRKKEVITLQYCLDRCKDNRRGVKYRGRILRQNLDKDLKRFPSCYP